MLSLAAYLVLKAGGAILGPKNKLPEVVIYWTGGRTIPPHVSEIVCAIWSDGHIVWRKPQQVRVVRRRSVKYPHAKFYEARISRDAVSHAFASIDARMIPKKGWGVFAYDVSAQHEVLRIGRRTAYLDVSEAFLNELSSLRPNDNKQIRLWNDVQKKAAKLIPKSGHAIAAPSDQEFRDWTDIMHR